MFRLLVILIVLWIALELLQRRLRRLRRSRTERGAGSRQLVRCATCGVHFPRPDGGREKAGLYCSEDCRQTARIDRRSASS